MDTPTQLLIGGRWVDPRGGEELPVEDPSTGQVVRRVALGRPDDADAAVAAARAAADDGPWPRMSPAERAGVLLRLGESLERHADHLTDLAVEEIGAPRLIARPMHVDRPMGHFYDMVEKGRRGLDEPLPPLGDPVTAQMIVREPRGVVSAITPWNFPHFLNLWKAAPALVTGNTVVLKPALETPTLALELGRLALEAGVPEGVLNVVTGGVDVGELLVTDPRVDMVTFTGSTAVGRRIGALAAPTVKHVILELGGKSALVALPDADVRGVVEYGMRFTLNCGQGCALMTRLVVADAIHDEVVEGLVGAVSRLNVGPAHDPGTHVGPLISGTHRDRVERYVEIGREEGAKVAVGGGRPPVGEGGYYIEPTIFTEVDPDARIAQEEIFGPVLCVIRFSGDPDEGVAIANNSEYGLAGAVWSRDTTAAVRLARRMRAGHVTVNKTASSNDGPFGGYKQSGDGRELGVLGLHEYTEVKHLAWGAG